MSQILSRPPFEFDYNSSSQSDESELDSQSLSLKFVSSPTPAVSTRGLHPMGLVEARQLIGLQKEQSQLAVMAAQEYMIATVAALFCIVALLFSPLLSLLILPAALYGFFKRRETKKDMSVLNLVLADIIVNAIASSSLRDEPAWH